MSMEDLHLDERFDGILYLEDQDFDKNNKLIVSAEDEGKTHIVMIFANWCGPCKATKDPYSQILNKVDQSKVRVACINLTGEEEGPYKNREGELKISKRISDIVPGFRGFPTIVLFDGKGNIVRESNDPAKMYKGNRSTDDLVKFANSLH
jgi:thiol-disulfide isomerase/thioredoxin